MAPRHSATRSGRERPGLRRRLLASNIAEAKVFPGPGTTSDLLKPSGAPDPATEEFGEAGIDLTAATAGLSNNGRACEQFGTAFGESRTSGSSTSAQMKDIVGPANINISNCVTPTIATTQTPSSGGLGASLSDSATMSGSNSLDGTGSVTFYLYAPGATCHNDGSGSPVYTHVASSTVSTNGPFASGSFGPPLVAGTYQWVAVFSGDGNNNGANSGCGNEPVVITASPTITTTQTPSSGGLGASLSDSATLHSTSNLLGTGSVTFYLYAPGATCHNDGSGTAGVHACCEFHVSTNGPFASGCFGPPLVAGTYHWVAVFSGDSNNTGADSGCANEPVVITASPSITTTQSETTGGWLTRCRIARLCTARATCSAPGR